MENLYAPGANSRSPTHDPLVPSAMQTCTTHSAHATVRRAAQAQWQVRGLLCEPYKQTLYGPVGAPMVLAPRVTLWAPLTSFEATKKSLVGVRMVEVPVLK